MIKSRNYGLLMPVSSLPSSEGIGTMGEEAYRFVDFLHSASATIWQMLPLNPTNYGDSPYASCCSNALNYYFIDLATLVKQRLLTKREVEKADLGNDIRRVDYGKQFYVKTELLRKAYSRFKHTKTFEKFVKGGEYHDFAAFMSLKSNFDYKSWVEWDEPYRTYNENTVAKYLEEHSADYYFWQFTQFVFLKQWKALKAYANSKGVKIMGDIPLYLAYDSVEVWKYGNKLFKVDEYRQPSTVAGVPPDAFSDDGQLWGNPIYNWAEMRKDGYSWWKRRISDCLNLFDILRIDHFRGFDRFYEIPAGQPTARHGYWSDGPKEELFADFLDKDIVAEDLGVIDDGVIRLMRNVGYPGMKILEFAFDGSPNNEHKPSNYTENFVCYTGTHDNMPLKQYIEDLGEYQFNTFKADLWREGERYGLRANFENSATICRSVINLAFESKANVIIIPMWDYLAQGGESRINLPSTVSPLNWSWRFVKSEINDGAAADLKALAEKTGRTQHS